MKKLFLIVASLLFLTACDETKLILPTELPQISQDFIMQHFENDAIDVAVYEKDDCQIEYKVFLTSGFQLEFKKDGTCKKINCKPMAIPNSVIPEIALQYVQTNFPNNTIISYELESKNRFKLELLNDLELLFKADGQFIKIED